MSNAIVISACDLATAENRTAIMREIAVVAMERSRMPIVVTDAQRRDNPIILTNQAFVDLTGYSTAEIIGQNCRFLQGVGTKKEDVAMMRAAIARGDDCIELELLNYRRDGTSFVNALMISAIRNDEGKVLYHYATQSDVSAQHAAKQLEASERRLLMEVDHRTLNTLALVQSIVGLSRGNDVDSLSKSINGRVGALGITHRLLAERQWRYVGLFDLIGAQLRGHAIFDRIKFEGQNAELTPKIVQPLGLVMHELISNSKLHGALAGDSQVVTLDCLFDNDALVVHWREPTDATDGTKFSGGFGIRLIQTLVEQQLNGQQDFEVNDGLLNVSIVIPRGIAQDN